MNPDKAKDAQLVGGPHCGEKILISRVYDGAVYKERTGYVYEYHEADGNFHCLGHEDTLPFKVWEHLE